MSAKSNPPKHEYSYSEIDAVTLYPEYPSPEEYDLSSVHFRSETRDFAREVYENGFENRRRIIASED